MKTKTVLGILLILVSMVQGQMVIKENTAVSLPCILIDDTDFKTQETGVGGGSVTVKWKHAADSTWTTKDVSSSGWDEIGDGVYEIDFGAGDIGSESGTNQGIFLYMVEGTGYLTYYGSAQMIPQSLKDNADDINAILTDTGTTLDNYVDGIEAKTNNLPADPADDSDIDAQLLAIDNYVDTEIVEINTTVTAIKAKTDNLPVDPADDSDIDAALLAIDNYVDDTGSGGIGTVYTWLTTDGNIVQDAELNTARDNIKANTSAEADRIILQGDSAWDTATGFSTLTASDNIGINWADITNPTTAVDLSGTVTKTVDTCSALTANNDKTGYTLASFTASWVDSECTDNTELVAVRDNVKANTSSEADRVITRGDTAWATATGFATHSAADVYSYFISGSNEDVFKATGFSTHSAADIWTVASRLITGGNLTTPNDYKASGFSTHSAADIWAVATRLITGGNLTTPADYKATGFSKEDNITDLELHGDIYWNTSTSGMSSDQNDTLYNIYTVVGASGGYDQSIADMLAYNASDGNVETDLDSAGGTTPSAVYDYFRASGRALNDSNGWLYNESINYSRMWDENLSDHSTADSAGEHLDVLYEINVETGMFALTEPEEKTGVDWIIRFLSLIFGALIGVIIILVIKERKSK